MSNQENNRKENDYKFLAILGIDVLIIATIFLIISCVKCNVDKFKQDQINNNLSSLEDLSSFNVLHVNDYLLNAANDCLKEDGKSSLEATSVISIGFNQNNKKLEYTSFVSDENDKLLSIKLNINANNLEEALTEINKGPIELNDYIYESSYLNVINGDSFINSSNFKSNITTNIRTYNTAKTDSLEPLYYFFGTYKENDSYISINGLQYDNGTNEFNLTNMKKEIATFGRSYLYLKFLSNNN